jgi:hypothetical protein
MNGANLDFKDAESFGDVQQAKRDNVFRVGFQNIHNLPEDYRTSKSRQLVDYLVQKDYNCFMMAEIGLNWTKISANDQWFERISGKFRTSRSVFAHKLTELHQSKVLQPGGVGLMSTDDVTHRIMATAGKDPHQRASYASGDFDAKYMPGIVFFIPGIAKIQFMVLRSCGVPNHRLSILCLPTLKSST